jgi:hypothetical protein
MNTNEERACGMHTITTNSRSPALAPRTETPNTELEVG